MSADIIEFPARCAYTEERDHPLPVAFESYWQFVGQRYECGCGNQYFQIGPDGILCPQCGKWHRPWE